MYRIKNNKLNILKDIFYIFKNYLEKERGRKMTTKKEREERRNAQIEKDKGYAIMVPNWVVKDYLRKIKEIIGEEIPFQDIVYKIEKLDWFGSGLRSINLETKVDKNGYFYCIHIFRDTDGNDKISIIERGCVNLNGKWVIHPDRGYSILKERTFESNEELSFILNSSLLKRKLSGEIFSDISIWIDAHS